MFRIFGLAKSRHEAFEECTLRNSGAGNGEFRNSDHREWREAGTWLSTSFNASNCNWNILRSHSNEMGADFRIFSTKFIFQKFSIDASIFNFGKMRRRVGSGIEFRPQLHSWTHFIWFFSPFYSNFISTFHSGHFVIKKKSTSRQIDK